MRYPWLWLAAAAPSRGCRTLLISGGQGHAGLNDRLSIFKHYGKIADALSANFVVDPPCKPWQMLAHHGIEAPRDRWWDDYFDLRRGSGAALLLRSSDMSKHKVANMSMVFVNSSAGDILAQFKKAQGSSCFVWHLPHYFNYGSPIKAPLIYAATNETPEITVLESATVTTLAETFVASLRSNFTTIHIRRGDTTEDCNTFTDRVVSLYETAAESAVASSNASAPIVVYFTDERKAAYLKDLDRRFILALPPQGEVIFGNTRVRSLNTSLLEDNYLLFAITSAIRSRATLDINFERSLICGRIQRGPPIQIYLHPDVVVDEKLGRHGRP